MSIAIFPVTPEFRGRNRRRRLVEAARRGRLRGNPAGVLEIFGADFSRPRADPRSAPRVRAEVRAGRNRPRARSEGDPEPPHRAFADISNLAPNGEIWAEDSRQRMYKAGNKLWHTDSSFKYLPSLCSLLYGRRIPPVGGHTEFADQRAAYDALPQAMKKKLRGRSPSTALPTRGGAAALPNSPRKSQAPAAGAADAGAHDSAERQKVALRCIARGPHIRHARRRGTRAHRRADRARDAAPIRLHASLASQRARDVGQPLHDAPRHRL